jgi:hypothetical protein
MHSSHMSHIHGAGIDAHTSRKQHTGRECLAHTRSTVQQKYQTVPLALDEISRPHLAPPCKALRKRF